MKQEERILFNRCMDVIFRNEGGYVNHKDDPGGETNFGICKRYFPHEDIKNLTKTKAKEIYLKHYWKPMNLFGIYDPEAVLQIFDFGINAGTKRAIRAAQQIVGVIIDGICGEKTKDAINDYEYDFVKDYKHSRRVYYECLADSKPKLQVFLKGWLNRVNNTKFDE